MRWSRAAVQRLPICCHADSWRSIEEIGPPRRYLKTFKFFGHYATRFHRHVGRAPGGRMDQSFWIDLGVDGYLQHSEAMKLYELGYFSEGDVLELGTFRGLSTSLIARALHDSGAARTLETCDIDPAYSSSAEAFVEAQPGGTQVRFHVGDATEFMQELEVAGRKFGMAFVDHWHSYDATYSAAVRLDSLLRSGGFAMFHDYNDFFNADTDHVHKVYQAVQDTIAKNPNFEFCGIFGLSGVFRKIR